MMSSSLVEAHQTGSTENLTWIGSNVWPLFNDNAWFMLPEFRNIDFDIDCLFMDYGA